MTLRPPAHRRREGDLAWPHLRLDPEAAASVEAAAVEVLPREARLRLGPRPRQRLRLVLRHRRRALPRHHPFRRHRRPAPRRLPHDQQRRRRGPPRRRRDQSLPLRLVDQPHQRLPALERARARSHLRLALRPACPAAGLRQPARRLLDLPSRPHGLQSQPHGLLARARSARCLGPQALGATPLHRSAAPQAGLAPMGRQAGAARRRRASFPRPGHRSRPDPAGWPGPRTHLPREPP